MNPKISIEILYKKDTGKKTKRVPFTEARVCFVPKEHIDKGSEDPNGSTPYWEVDWQQATYKHEDNGHYVPDPTRTVGNSNQNPALNPYVGEWLLVIQPTDKSPVIQRITLKETKIRVKEGQKTVLKDALEVKPGWGKETKTKHKATVKTVDIVNYRYGEKAGTSLITVTVYDRLEHVYLASQYAPNKKNIYYERFFKRRIRDVWRKRLVNPGTRFTLFDCKRGLIELYVKADSGWLVVEKKPTDKPHRSTNKPESGKGDQKHILIIDDQISILDFYKYIDSLGVFAPKTLMEANIYGHGETTTPVLWNTYDSGWVDNERYEYDLDGRSKDWQADGPMKEYPNISDAFHDDGFFKFCGCNNDPLFRKTVVKAVNRIKSNKDREEFFVVSHLSPLFDVWANTNLNIEKRNIALQFASMPYQSQHYSAAAGAFLSVPAYGTPPSLFSEYYNNRFVVFGSKKSPSGKGINRKVLKYFKLEFDVDKENDIDEFGYLNYSNYTNDSYSAFEWRTNNWKLYNRYPNYLPIALLPGKIVFVKNYSAERAIDIFKIEAQESLLGNNQPGHLYYTEHTKVEAIWQREQGPYNTRRLSVIPTDEEGDIQQDIGIYVQEDGNCFLVERIHSEGHWKLYKRETGTYFFIDSYVRNASGKWYIDEDGGYFSDNGAIRENGQDMHY